MCLPRPEEYRPAAMSPASWQVSATYLKATVGAMRVLGHYDRVQGQVSTATRTMLESPHAQAWWPGDVLVDVMTALGPASGREVGVRASRDGMGPLVKPLASVLLALTKSPPHALVSRIGTFVSAGVKGVDARFVPNGTDTGGVVTFTFPQPVPPEMAAVWAGLFDVGFTLARGGQVTGEHVEPTTHRYDVAW